MGKKAHNVWTQARLGHETWAEFFSLVKTEVFGGRWCGTQFWMVAYVVSKAEA